MAKSKKVMKRFPYTIYLLCFLFLIFCGQIFAGVTERVLGTYRDPVVAGIIFVLNFVPVIFAILFGYYCAARRLRDCRMSPYLAWLLIVPLAFPFFFIYLCFPKSK